jgi:hypothetical protein
MQAQTQPFEQFKEFYSANTFVYDGQALQYNCDCLRYG